VRKFTIYFTLLLLFPVYAWSQIDLCLPLAAAKGGAITAEAKDWEAIGINPSNLGWECNHKFSITILNVGISAESSALDFSTLKNALIHPGDTFSTAEKQHLANVLSNPNGLNLYGDVNWAAFSFYFPKVGGFAVNLRERVTAHLTLSPTASDIIFNGWNSAAYMPTNGDTNILKEKMSQVLDGTNFAYYHYRELNLDYGRKLFQIGGTKESVSRTDASSGKKVKADSTDPNALEVYGGLGLKYIWGLANVYAEAINGTIVAHSAVSSSYGINYGDIPNFSPTSAPNLFNNTGHGYGMDIGISGAYKKWKFGIAATDIGSITWNHNTLTTVDTNMPKLNANNKGIDAWTQISDFAFSNHSILNFRPGPDYAVVLPTKLRTGISYNVIKQVTVSADAIFPLNNVLGNLENPYYAIAGQLDIVKGVSISLGFAGNQVYGFDMPFGLSLGLRNILEFYIGTADILTWFGRVNNPNVSVAFGLLRFNL
jgi:hypothetical protein